MSAPDGGSSVLHRERLWPSGGVWFLTVVPGVFTGIAAGPVNLTLSVVLGILVTAGVITALALTTPVVEVRTDGTLRAGRAVLPVRFVTGVEPATGPRARAMRGVDLDARTHLLLRGWIDPVVRVDLDDPEDPHPAWVVSTREPEHLARAVLALARPSAQRWGGPTGPAVKEPGPAGSEAADGVEDAG